MFGLVMLVDKVLSENYSTKFEGEVIDVEGELIQY